MALKSFVATSLAAAALSDPCNQIYDEYVVEWGKTASDDGRKRFCLKLAEIENHNSQNLRWRAGVNRFTDKSPSEVALYLGDPDPAIDQLEPSEVPSADLSVEAMDWRWKMPDVKNQHTCGSCWTFGAVAVVDFLGSSHSEQQIGDCSSDNLCRGGSATAALKYLAGAGSCSENDYPYNGVQGSCYECTPSAYVGNIQQVSGHDAILSVLQNQVISLSFTLNDNGPFMSYGKQGDVYDTDCGTGAGHAVAAVGYQDDYWIMRNSWGEDWGVGGYFYFKKGIDLCAMETRRPVFADVWSASPSPTPEPPSPSPGPTPPSWYKTITPLSNGYFCIDLPGGEVWEGAPVWLWECSGYESQRWVFDNWQIRYGADEGYCLDAGGMYSGTQLSIWGCNGYPQQTFGMDDETQRMYIAGDPLGWGTCLDWYDPLGNGQPLHTWDCADDNYYTQQWALWNV